MKSRILAVLLPIFCTGCVIPVHTIKRSDQGIYKEYTVIELFRSDAEVKADELYAQDVAIYKAEQQAKEDAKKAQELQWKREEEAEYAKLKKDFDKEMADTKCYKEKWTRYEFGEYFQGLANKHNISAYDVIFGDQYTKRNINPYIQAEAMDNYLRYAVRHFSKAESAVYNKDENKRKQLFNKIVKKDYSCYLKLK